MSRTRRSVWSDLRRLRRAREGRVIGGVCAGVGPQLRVDPVVLRVIVAVLAVFGGVGLLLYLIAWAVLPVADPANPADTAPLEGRTGGGKDRPLRIAAVVIGLLVLASIPWWGVNWDGPALLLLALLGLVTLIRRPAPTASTDRPKPGEADPASARGGTPPPHAAAQATSGVVLGQPTAPRGPSWRELEPAPPEFWEQDDPLGLAETPVPDDDPLGLGLDAPAERPVHPPVPVPRSRPPKPRSYLFGLTIAGIAIATGVLGFVDIGVDLPASAYVGMSLGVVGLALVVGTWFGRSRALIGLGVVLVIALLPVMVLERLPGGFVDRSYAPTSAAEVRPGYEVGAGTLVLDLRKVGFTDATDVRTAVEVGAGDARVIVPDNVDVDIEADIGFGDAQLLDRRTVENDTARVVDNGPDGEGGGRLRLAIHVGAGDMEVMRDGR